MKKLIFTTHLVTNIVIQSHLWGTMIFYYNMSAGDYVSYTLLCLALLLADYSITSLLLRKANTRLENKYHFQDLVCAVPSVLMTVKEILQIVVTRHIGRLKANIITTIIIVLVINALLVCERFILIRKK